MLHNEYTQINRKFLLDYRSFSKVYFKHLWVHLSVYSDTFTLCTLDWLGTHYVAWAGFSLTVISLPQPPDHSVESCTYCLVALLVFYGRRRSRKKNKHTGIHWCGWDTGSADPERTAHSWTAPQGQRHTCSFGWLCGGMPSDSKTYIPVLAPLSGFYKCETYKIWWSQEKNGAITRHLE